MKKTQRNRPLCVFLMLFITITQRDRPFVLWFDAFNYQSETLALVIVLLSKLKPKVKEFQSSSCQL